MGDPGLPVLAAIVGSPNRDSYTRAIGKRVHKGAPFVDSLLRTERTSGPAVFRPGRARRSGPLGQASREGERRPPDHAAPTLHPVTCSRIARACVYRDPDASWPRAVRHLRTHEPEGSMDASPPDHHASHVTRTGRDSPARDAVIMSRSARVAVHHDQRRVRTSLRDSAPRGRSAMSWPMSTSIASRRVRPRASAVS
jgi:hypothetical protein